MTDSTQLFFGRALRKLDARRRATAEFHDLPGHSNMALWKFDDMLGFHAGLKRCEWAGAGVY